MVFQSFNTSAWTKMSMYRGGAQIDEQKSAGHHRSNDTFSSPVTYTRKYLQAAQIIYLTKLFVLNAKLNLDIVST